MRILLPFVFAAALSSPLLAQERPYAPGMSCQNVAGLVAARGSVVLGTGPNAYERVVLDQRFCPREETTAPAWHPTRDDPRCFVGYRCKDKFNEEKHG